MLSLETLKSQYRSRIIGIAEKYGAENIRVFGSVARGEQRGNSDIDFLVTLQPKTTLLKLAAMERELSELLGCTIDVVSERALSPYFRDQVLDEATPL